MNRSPFVTVTIFALTMFACCDSARRVPESPAFMATGCKGAKTSLDFTVRVDPANCKERQNEAFGAQHEYAILDCLSGEGNVKVVFPREEWHAMKHRAVGTVDAGPGK